MTGQAAEFLAGSRVPQANLIVTASPRSQSFAIRRKSHTVDAIIVPLQLAEELSCGHVPEMYRCRSIVICRGQVLAVRGEGHVVHRTLMSREPTRRLAGRRVPQPDCPVSAGRGQGLSVGRKGQGLDVILSRDWHRGLAGDLSTVRQFPHFDVRGRVPQANGIITASRGEGLAVRRKRQALDLSLMPAEIMEFLS